MEPEFNDLSSDKRCIVCGDSDNICAYTTVVLGGWIHEECLYGRTPDLTEALARLKALEERMWRESNAPMSSRSWQIAKDHGRTWMFNQSYVDAIKECADEIAAIRKAMGLMTQS